MKALVLSSGGIDSTTCLALTFMIGSQGLLWFEPNAADIMNPAMTMLSGLVPRVAAASIAFLGVYDTPFVYLARKMKVMEEK